MREGRDMELVNELIDYEDGKMGKTQEVEFFAYLIKTSKWLSLCDKYAQRVSQYIDAGIIDKQGTIDWGIFNAITGGA